MNRSKGITLLEAVAALALVAVLSAVAVPAISRAAERARAAYVQTALSESFMTAARLAVATGSAAIVCPVGASGDCRDGDDWSDGWKVFMDVDGDRKAGAYDTLVRSVGATAGIRVYSSQGRKRVVFQPQGDSAGSNASFLLCARRGAPAAWLVLSGEGRFRAVDPRNPPAPRLCE
ncbi:GspH/FimT family protein [Lysobacter enzymogenes]|uniref:GspH/FimT family protein n=1 Tax=Lysobacter enzymogenes TaxID=69 RepID=UPI001A974BCD|nr:GspH/FimT family pseudopilin [Lysobacter enzymogenes]QQP98113.1 GspH/FimT family pseudopilin [Lysobacter enzymogenes]